jgi:TPR repeat protein
MNTLKSLSDLNNETMSIINNQLAIEAIESGDTKLGIETLQTSIKDGRNAAALYNLGICYERGIGVEQDRAKVNDFRK